MVNPNRSADSAYYASKQPLNIRGTREGRKIARTPVSYRQTAGSAASSDKYYAEKKPAAVQKVRVVEKKTATVEASPRFMLKVASEFKAGATNVVVSVVETELVKVRNTVELAVGQGKLTREQADAVSFDVIKLPEPEPVPEPVQEKPKKKRGRPRKKKVEAPIEEAVEILEPKLSEEEQAIRDADAEEIQLMGANIGKAKDVSKDITEDDVARAFGVVQEEDSDD